MNSLKINCILISTIIFWASAFIGIKLGLSDYSPGALALLRFLVASISIAIIYKSQNIETSVSWPHRLLLMLAGMAGIGVYNICLNIGELSVSAGVASFVIGLMPVMTIVLSLFFLNEKQSNGVWVGVLISLLGLFVLAFWEGFQENMGLGIALILVSTFTGALLTIIQKHYAKYYHPVAIISWMIWGGTLLLFIFLPQLLREIKVASPTATIAAIYMGIFPGAIAYYAWGLVLKTVSASKTSISLYALPILSTLLGFIFLHEQPSFTALAGGSITLVGAFIAHHYQERQAEVNNLDNTVTA